MLTKIFALLCLLALHTYAYEEILPSRTVELDSRAEPVCNHYHAEVRLSNRRIGFLSFNSEGAASVTKDRRSAAKLHTDSSGRTRAGKSYVGTRPSAKKYTSLKALPKKKGAASKLDGLCYSSKTGTVYSGSVPPRLQCKPVTIEPSCVKHQHYPNPSDGAHHKKIHRDEDGIPAMPLATRSVRFNPAWEAMRAAL